MFSGIRDFLRSVGVSRDAQTYVPQQRKPVGDRQARPPAPVAPDDDTLFSIAAIRALLTTEPLPADVAAALAVGEKDTILKGLAALEAQGIHNIPLQLNQSLLDAVRDAMPRNT